MAKARRKGRPRGRDNYRHAKKRASILTTEKIQYVDWKDHSLLNRFISDRAKIRSRRVTGNTVQQQKLVANAIKLAREMALLPYASRVTTQRQHRERDGFRRSPGFSQKSFSGDSDFRGEKKTGRSTDGEVRTTGADSADVSRDSHAAKHETTKAIEQRRLE